MTTKFKILSSVAFITLAIVLTFVGVWALTDLDFTVGGNITYTAPAGVKDVSEYTTLQFYVINSTAKTVSVQANRSKLPTGELVIPAKVLSNGEEYTVTSINYVSSGTLLKSATQNFDKEIELPEMQAPPSGETTTYYAFNECVGLTSVIIPDSVTSIEASAFMNCTGLASVMIGNGVTTIESSTFRYCSGLSNLTIGNSVTRISDLVFANCSTLSSISIPDSVTGIGSHVFQNCSNLTSVKIGNGIEYVGEGVFNNCGNLIYNIYDNAKYLGNDVNPYVVLIKANSTSINSCNINSNCKVIFERAFSACSLLTSITIPNRVISIGFKAFEDCIGLTLITIPNSVRAIDRYSFYGCTKLATVTVQATTPPTAGDLMFNNCHSSLQIKVPSASVNAYKSATYWKDYNIVDGGF